VKGEGGLDEIANVCQGASLALASVTIVESIENADVKDYYICYWPKHINAKGTEGTIPYHVAILVEL
jgi:hypothetical protein